MSKKYNPLSLKTRKAIAKYGLNTCRAAFAQNEAGDGPSTIAFETPGLKTTNQADAAINAGRELASFRVVAGEGFKQIK